MNHVYAWALYQPVLPTASVEYFMMFSSKKKNHLLCHGKLLSDRMTCVQVLHLDWLYLHMYRSGDAVECPEGNTTKNKVYTKFLEKDKQWSRSIQQLILLNFWSQISQLCYPKMITLCFTMQRQFRLVLTYDRGHTDIKSTVKHRGMQCSENQANENWCIMSMPFESLPLEIWPKLHCSNHKH